MKKNGAFLSFFILLLFFATENDSQIMTTFAGTGTLSYGGDGGPAFLAQLMTPSGVAVDKNGYIYITDQNNSRIRKVSPSDTITTIAGTGATGYSGDGMAATIATLNWPTGLAVDDTGNVYIADQFNNVIRKVNAATGIISTIAGDNALLAGYTGDGGPATAASLWHPADVGLDRGGNVYFVDQNNSVVRKVTVMTGIITTIAGDNISGYTADGILATASELNFPQGIALDSSGNVYIADYYNSRIRKVDAITGIITTVAGNGTQGYTGDGGQATSAELYDASAVALDDTGNIYISDYYNSVIRKVSATTGIIKTVAGNGTADYCCDCKLATNAEINYPEGVAVDKKGNIYIADFGNSRVRKVTDSSYCNALETDAENMIPVLKIFPNPSDGRFYVEINKIMDRQRMEVYNVVGEEVYRSEIRSLRTDIDLPHLPVGVYTLRFQSEGNNIVQKLIITR